MGIGVNVVVPLELLDDGLCCSCEVPRTLGDLGDKLNMSCLD